MSLRAVILNIRTLFQVSAAVSWPETCVLSITVKSRIALELLSQIDEFGIRVSLQDAVLQRALIEGRKTFCEAGTVIKLALSSNPKKLLVVQNLDHLLSFRSTLTEEPAAFIIFENGKFTAHVKEDKFCYNEDLSLVWYCQALQLWDVLVKVADFRPSLNKIIFLGSSRVDIIASYSVKDLSVTAVMEIKDFLGDANRKDIRKEIVKSCIIELTKDYNESDRFVRLLKSTPLLARRLKEAMSMYLTENSPSRLVQEAEKKVMEFTDKIDKAISAMEAKTLALPAAILLGFKDMKVGQGLNSTNCIIIFSFFLFGIVLWWTTETQRGLLNHIKKQLVDKRNELLKMGLSQQNENVRNLFSGLERRVDLGKRALVLIRVTTVASFVTLLIFILFSNT